MKSQRTAMAVRSQLRSVMDSEIPDGNGTIWDSGLER